MYSILCRAYSIQYIGGLSLVSNKRGTKTSSFGSPGKRSHNSKAFYASRLYDNMPKEQKTKYVENPISQAKINYIFWKSSENMNELLDNSIHLMVTSPPYNVGKDYDEDLTLEEYREFLKRVWKEVYRVLVPGGRACVNIANLGRKPYIPLHAFIIQDMIDLGFLMRGEIIWDKAASAAFSTAWGSWCSASNPVLRDVHEYILVFSKLMFGRKNPELRSDTISQDDFFDLTKSIWTFSTVSAKRIGHPAPFPEELAARLIELYSFEGEVILDPFMGSGQTAIAARCLRRLYIGYEINQDYIDLANRRLAY